MYTTKSPMPHDPGSCPKCGHQKVSFRYDDTVDRLQNKCQVCGYGWSSTPVDHGASDITGLPDMEKVSDANETPA